MQTNSENRLFTEEESRMSTRRWLYIITCWILILVFIVFGGHTGDDEGIPMERIGGDGVELNMTSGMSVRNDNAAVVPTDTEFHLEEVEYNTDSSRDGDEIDQADLDTVMDAISDLEAEGPKEDETTDVPAVEVIVEDTNAGTVIEANETGGSEKVDPTQDTAGGDGQYSNNMNWGVSD